MGANTRSRAEGPAMHWAQGLGEERHARDDRVARMAQSEEDDAAQMAAVAIERWAAIVASMRGLADAYNAGARRVVLTIVEQSAQSTVTVATGGEGTPFLTAALEGTLICIHGRHSGGFAHATEIRLRPDRADDATAAYVLRDWMQRL